jgi:phosphatidylethanolamine-binding protein (PEBP) family uncharacterized protein
MEKEGIVPDVVDVLPSNTAVIKYASGAVVNGGNELTPTAVKDIPTVLEWPAEDEALYTVAMSDPDAPSRINPKYREWLHWLVVNVPANKVADGQVLAEYVGSGPPKGTGLHRYVFMVFKQPNKLTPDEKKLTNRSGEGRGSWKLRSFAAKYNLGNPVAGNFYQAQWDDYVPKLYEQLSGD